jgi:tetratricopeptide (TPR) repeat protein
LLGRGGRWIVTAVRPQRFARAAGLAVMLAASVARADGRTDLEKAYSAYMGHKYDDAESRLRALLDPATGTLKDPDTIADARMYLGAVLAAEGKKDEAGKVFEALLVAKPDYEPDPLRVSTEAVDAFYDVRARLRTRLVGIKTEQARVEQEARERVEAERQREAARVAMLEKLAGEEVVRQPGSRWVALLPFGVGQFQNGQDTLGGLLLATEAALVVGSGISAGITLYDAGKASDASRRSDPTGRQYQQYAQLAATVGNLMTAGFALVAIAGAVQAQIAFVPERIQVRKRPVPGLSLAPVAPLVSGAGVGFTF